MAAALMTAAWMFRPMLDADFAAIDDWEPASFLRDGTSALTISDAVSALVHKTEVGKTFSSTRYRPTYYILRVTETYLWGLNPKRWFTARYCMVMFAFTVMLYLATEFVGPICGALLAVLALTPIYWADTWGRAGPAEQYGTVGLALLSCGWFRCSRPPIDERPPTWAIAAICLGCLISEGTKELFLPTVTLPVAFLVFSRVRNRLKPIQIVLCAIPVAYAALIVWTVVSGIAHTGATAYGQHLDAGYFGRVIGRFVDLALPYAAGMAGVGLLLIWRASRSAPNSKVGSSREISILRGTGIAYPFLDRLLLRRGLAHAAICVRFPGTPTGAWLCRPLPALSGPCFGDHSQDRLDADHDRDHLCGRARGNRHRSRFPIAFVAGRIRCAKSSVS